MIHRVAGKACLQLVSRALELACDGRVARSLVLEVTAYLARDAA